MKKSEFKRLCRRFSNGGADPAALSTTPAATPTEVPKPTTAEPEKTAEKQPETTETKQTAEKTFSQADIDSAVKAAVETYKQEQESVKDYNKMSPEQKVAYLEAQAEERKMKDFTVGHLKEQNLPSEFASFLQGKDENETKVKTADFKAAYEKAIQEAVVKRFKENGYQPSAGNTATSAASVSADTLEAAIAEKLNLK